MAKGHKAESVIASCADYDETAGEEVTSTRKIANVGAKRSSDTLIKGGGAEVTPVDLASDSGYSSRTQATSASADSTASIRAKAEQAIALQEHISANRQHLSPIDGETQSQRSGSTASTNTKTKKRVACKEPNCDKCVAARKKAAEAAGRKPKPKVSVDTNVSPVKSRERSPVKQPTSTTLVHHKPEIHQQAAPPQIRRRDSQQAGPRPQSMHEMHSPYAGMDPRQAAYFSRAGYQDPRNPGAVMVVERPGAGAMVSARGGARGGMRGAPAYNPQAGAVPSARRVPNPTVVQVDNRAAENRAPDARAAKIQQQLAAATRAQQPKPQPKPRLHTQVIESPSESEEEDEYYEDEDEDGSEYDEDELEEESVFSEHTDELAAAKRMRAIKKQQNQARDPMAETKRQLAAAHAHEQQLLEQRRVMEAQRRQQMEEVQRRQQLEEARRAQMPPPMLPPSAMPAGLQIPQMPQMPQMPSPSPQAGPSGFSMRKAQQPQITYGERRPSELEHLDPDLRASLRSLTPGPSGSSANRRPSLASSGGTKATSYSHPGHPQYTVESRNGRRMSYFGSEKRDELADMHTGFQRKQSMNMHEMIAQAVREQFSKLHINNRDEPQTVNFAMDDKLQDAMRYQSKVDHVGQNVRRDTLTDLPTIPLTQAALRRNTGIPSLSGSSRSKRSSDEDPSLVSAGHRLTSGSEAGFAMNEGEMKLRIDYANGFEMEVEGRRVKLIPVGDGTTADLVIGGAADPRGETSYMSARGSTATKSVINRQPSQRQRRPARDDVYELEDSDDRTERRTVYRREEARRDREERQREEEEERRREARRLEKQRERDDLEREREEKRLRKERKALRRERAELEEQRREQSEQQRRRRSKYDDEFDDESESEEYSSEEEDRRTQKTTRRRAKTYEEKRERKRSPEKRHRDDGNYRYPANYGRQAGFNPQF